MASLAGQGAWNLYGNLEWDGGAELFVAGDNGDWPVKILTAG